MRLSETITIYLAAGSSFGVYDFFCFRDRKLSRRKLLRSLLAGLLWPLAAARLLFSRKGKKLDAPDGVNAPAHKQFIEKIEGAQGALLDSLDSVREKAQKLASSEQSKSEIAFRTVREAIEKYTELTLSATFASPKDAPSERELELYRVAGRSGHDLRLAGRCIHRRNISRLISHQARSRTELLHALAELRELNLLPLTPVGDSVRRHLSVALVRVFSHAFNLLSLLEDKSAAASVARLLDSECLRLRSLEPNNSAEKTEKDEESIVPLGVLYQSQRHLEETI